MKDTLRQGLDALSLSLDEAQLEQCCQFGAMVAEKNKVMNLTSITEPQEMARLHFVDSLALLRYASFDANARVLDLGSGAGFPGMPLAIARPQTSFTLLDALNKRIVFLQEAVQQLGLKNVKAVHARAEELAQSETYREQFSIVTSRAVADLRMLAELALPFLQVGGIFLAMKSVDTQAEVDAAARAISLLGGRLLPQQDYHIEGTDIIHRVVIIKKIKQTDIKYPRRFAKIQKNPL